MFGKGKKLMQKTKIIKLKSLKIVMLAIRFLLTSNVHFTLRIRFMEVSEAMHFLCVCVLFNCLLHRNDIQTNYRTRNT